MTGIRYRRAGTACAALALLAAAAPSAPASAQTPPSPGLGIDTTHFDRAVRPQDDFFRFANGSWLRNTRIPDDRSTYGAFVELDEESQAALRAIVEEAATSPGAAGTARQKVGDFYASFLDSAAVERRGLDPLRNDLARIAAVDGRDDLPGLFAHLLRQGINPPFTLYVNPDAKQATRYAVYLSQSGLGLPDRSYYLSDDAQLKEAREAYRLYAVTLLRLAGTAGSEAAADAVLRLETVLATRQWDRTRNRDREATYNAFGIDALSTLASGLDWRALLAETDALETPVVIVRQPDYLRGVDSLLATTPIETWKQYLTVRLLDSYADVLPSAFARASFEFRGRTLQGLPEQRPRWKRGIDAAEAALGMELGRIYVERHFRPEAKARMDELVANLVEAFRAGIDQLEWMTPATRAEARLKLARFDVKIGYPDEWPEHEGLEVRRDELLENVQRARRFHFQEMVDDLGQPIDREEWAMTPQTVNAYYNSVLNEIVFPAAILQPPFFDVTADDAVNYGAIGAVIGHEISHGFDDQGRRSDGEGNLRDWWRPEDARAFEARADRLALQYGAYVPLEGLPINGRLTLGENIGDLSGLAVAYEAYQRSLGGKPAPVIGGLTGDQRFFLGWAQIWRTLFREEALRQRLLTDTHSPGEFRVNGVLRNLEEFHEAFDVKPGDGMYMPPGERVEIW